MTSNLSVLGNCHAERSEASSRPPPWASTTSDWILHFVQNDDFDLKARRLIPRRRI
jgi:hypothetical protein